MLHDFEEDIQEQDIPTLDVNEGPPIRATCSTMLRVINVSMYVMTETEVIQEIKHLKNGKAAGTDGIHVQPELLKHAELIAPQLTNLFNMVWQNKEVPTE